MAGDIDLDEDEGSGGRRKGRGRLSSIDMLPESCDEDVRWLHDALAARKLPQTEILRQFNALIAARGQDAISVGAFSRYSVAKVAYDRKLEAGNKITQIALARFAGGDRSEQIVAATELVKCLLVETMIGDEAPTLKDLNNAALVLNRLSRTAIVEGEAKRREAKLQREEDAATAAQEKAEREEAAKRQAEADAEQITAIAQSAGLSEDRIAAIRRGVLGLTA